MNRREFLTAAAIGRLAIPAVASPSASLFFQFQGSGRRQTLNVFEGSPPTKINTLSIRVDSSAMREYMELIRQPSRATYEEIFKIACDLYVPIWGRISPTPLSYRDVYIWAEDDFEGFAFEALHGGRQWIGRAAAIHYVRGWERQSTPFRLLRRPEAGCFAYAPFTKAAQGIPWAVREARFMAKLTNAALYEGNQATKLQLLTDMEQPFDVVHIATHGVVKGPEYAAIALRDQLSADGEHKGSLGPEDIGSTRCDGGLVVLSACSLNPAATNALVARLLEQGISEVISSRFAALDDASAFTFMQRFYEELRTGATSGIALLKARSVMIDGSYGAYKHPYFWAAFRSDV